MYTDENLSSAVKAGIFTDDAASKFRAFVSNEQGMVTVDEEHFRLVTGFNDIFVVIACGLLLVSVGWIGREIATGLGLLAVAITSWGLSEFFVLKRKMALPAIVLLLTFIVGISGFAAELFRAQSTNGSLSFLAAGCTGLVASYLHWLRFRVPITVAAGVAVVIGSIIAFIIVQFPKIENWSLLMLFIGGLSSFAIAMHWDMKDPNRLTRKSDVAFWLHLLAAPFIVHPIFFVLGVFEGKTSIPMALIVIGLYLVLGVISIAIDRRALMVSALAYVLFSFTSLLKTYGLVSLGFSITGVVIGSALLLLSAFWHTSRTRLLNFAPKRLLTWLPPLK
ncbi:hypothetical protein MCETALH18_00096 [Methylophilaceae bacterium]